MLGAGFPDRYVAEMFHSLRGSRQKDVASLEMMQSGASLRSGKTSCDCLESSSKQPDLNLYPASCLLKLLGPVEWESLMVGEVSHGGR